MNPMMMMLLQQMQGQQKPPATAQSMGAGWLPPGWFGGAK